MDLHLTRVGLVAVAAVALVASATGGAVADRLITSDDIKNHTIERQDLADDSVGPRILRDNSVHLSKLSPTVRERLATAGAPGPAGAAGAAGPSGVSGYTFLTQEFTGPEGAIVELDCPPGTSVFGGGINRVVGGGFDQPQADGSGWMARLGGGPGASDSIVELYAICARA